MERGCSDCQTERTATVSETQIRLDEDEIPTSDKHSLLVISDASFGNHPDGETIDMGYLSFLSMGFSAGESSLCSLLSWTACKVWMKVSSTETLSLFAALEQAVVMGHHITKILNKSPQFIKIEAFIDNKDAYEAIHSTIKILSGRL